MSANLPNDDVESNVSHSDTDPRSGPDSNDEGAPIDISVVPGAVPQGETRIRDHVIWLTNQLPESKSRSLNEIQWLNRHCDNKDARFSMMKLALTQAKWLAESRTRSFRSELYAKLKAGDLEYRTR
jgi:hypothetical protein